MRWQRRLVLAAAVVVGLALALAGWLAALARTPLALVSLGIALAVGPLAVALALVVVRRSDAGRVAVLLACVGTAATLVETREVAWEALADHRAVAESLAWLVAALSEFGGWLLVSVALLLLYFPDGRLPGPRWRWVPPALVSAAAITQAYGAFEPVPFRAPLELLDRPFGRPPVWLDALQTLAFPLMLALLLASAASLAVRYRRADHRRRTQLKWLAVGGSGVMFYPLVCGLEIIALGKPFWFSAAVGLGGLLGVPIAVAIATLRHDLYDVDKALAGTVTWGLLTVVLAGVYLAVTIGAGALVGGDNALVASAATALCALVFIPLRRLVQGAVDSRLYPLKRAAVVALDALQRDVGAGTADPTVLEEVLRTALRDPGLRVGFMLPGETDQYMDAIGRRVEGDGGALVQLGGATTGVLVPGPSGASPGLLRDVAVHASTMVEVARLRLELARALHDVNASRARLVQIGYEERRRLERDLHDGAQQRLVSLGMSIRLAQRHLGDGTIDVNDLLDECMAELGTAVAELRQIAHGIRPTSLDDGLPAAVSRLVRSVPIPVDSRVDASRLPHEIASTAYFVISEALTNAVKHAEASRIGLEVSRQDGHLVVRVSDDGRGGALLSGDSGLADRVAALGGLLRVKSPIGSGTVVEAELPCVS